MKFCERHWTDLRKKIEERGIGHLIAPDTEVVVAQQFDEMTRGEVTPVNFEPLMSAHWAIASNVLRTIPKATGYLLQGDDVPEDPVEADHGTHALRYTSRTWSRCPLCYLNLAHAISCTDWRCKLDRENGYAWMLDKAADEAKDKAASL